MLATEVQMISVIIISSIKIVSHFMARNKQLGILFDYTTGVATDSSGNVFIGGYTHGDWTETRVRVVMTFLWSNIIPQESSSGPSS